jgi:hypothetical protein
MRVVTGSNPVSNSLKVSSFGRAIGVSPIGSRFDSCTFDQNPLVLGTDTLLGTRRLRKKQLAVGFSQEALSIGFCPVLNRLS